MASRGNIDAIKMLLPMGCAIDYETKTSSTALSEAAISNQIEALLLLIEHGAHIDREDKQGAGEVVPCVSICTRRCPTLRLSIEAADAFDQTDRYIDFLVGRARPEAMRICTAVMIVGRVANLVPALYSELP